MYPFLDRDKMFQVISFNNTEKATVISRPNRFMVKANLHGKIIDVHIHDPGRLEELIFPGNEIIIRETPDSRTKYSVTFCKNNDLYTFNDSRYHSLIASKFIKEGYKKEVKTGKSRLDFQYMNSFIEVKSATLVENGIAMFPDAVTERGTRHLKELMNLAALGYDSYVLFLIFNGHAESFIPNSNRDKIFSGTFYNALDNNVHFKFLKFVNDEKSVFFSKEIFLRKN